MNTKIVAPAALAACLFIAASASAKISQDQIPFQAGSPSTNGCPRGWEAFSVAVLTTRGYRVDEFIDSDSAGGNNDGIVCGFPWASQEQDARAPEADHILFNFMDNILGSYTNSP